MKKIAPDIYASTEYPGVNVGFVVAPGGAIAVDAPALPGDARAWRQRITDIAGGPVLYVVLTDTHPDRLLSAGLLGSPIVAARAAYDHASTYTDGFWRGIIDKWKRRYPESSDDLAEVAHVLPEVLLDNRLTLRKGGKDVTVERIAGAAPGSARLYFREERVLFIGDTLVVDTHPFMDAVPDSKEWLDTLTTFRRKSFSNVTFVPGRGPLCDQSSTLPLSEYIALVRRRARSLNRTAYTRADKTEIVEELLPFFPVPDDEHKIVRRRVKANLERVCEELEPE